MSLRILVADDEQLAARLLAENLEDFGFPGVAVVFTVESAIEYIEKNQPDLVFLDVNFKTAVSGMDVLRRVSQTTPQSKICLMSGYRDDCKAEALALGAVAFVGKPALMEEYIQVARSLKSTVRQG